MVHLVFVYGTLKTGEPNHKTMSETPGEYRLVSHGTTVEKFPLIVGTKYNLPFLLDQPGNGNSDEHGRRWQTRFRDVASRLLSPAGRWNAMPGGVHPWRSDDQAGGMQCGVVVGGKRRPAEEKAMIMSKHGAGRAGYFVALAVAVHKMDQKSEPNMFEIVKSIRLQRPKAVETVTQYASLYEATFEKIAQLEEKKEKAEARIGALETVMAEQRAEVEELRKMMAELKATMGKRAAPEALFLRAFAEEMAQSGNFGEATATGDGVKYKRGGRGNYKWKHLSIRDCFADDWKKIAEAAMKTLSKEERNIFLQNRQTDLLPQIPPSPPIQSTQDDESDVESDISA